jgi:diguanylate cyclase (GGDEF)-like protein
VTNKNLPPAADKSARLQRKVDRMWGLLARYKHNKSVQNAMLQLSELASTVTDISDFYGAIHGVVGNLLRAENFYVVLVDPQTDCFTPVYYSDQTDATSIEDLESNTFKEGLTGYVYRTSETLLCDGQLATKLAEQGDIVAYGIVSSHWMGVPLMRSGHPIGVIAAQTYDQSQYSEADQELMEFISLHLVTAIDRMKQRELLEQSVLNRTQELNSLNNNLQIEIKERQRAEALQGTLFEISQITATSVLMDDFYRDIHGVLKTLIYAENCYIALLSPDGERLEFPYYVDLRKKGVDREFGQGLTEYVIKQGEACLVDAELGEKLTNEGVIVRRQNDRVTDRAISTCWLGAPLVINDKVIGVVATQIYDNEHQYSAKDLDVLRFVSNHLAVAIQRKLASDDLRLSHDELESEVLTRTQELRQSNLYLKLQIEERKKAEEKLSFEANHDALTSLPNRKMLLEQLNNALALSKKGHQNLRKSDDQCSDEDSANFAVLFIDLDRFKLINDTLGHQAGDGFLIEVSLRIAGCIREQDILARLGGDEFVILLNDVLSLDDVEEIAERIIVSVGQPFYIHNEEVYSGASIGIAQCHDTYNSADDLLRDADAAMYQAKNMGRGRFIVFDETMHQRLMDDLTIEQALHRAVKAQLLLPHYTPIFQMQSYQQLGCDAKINWQHPDLADVEEQHLIELAQSNGVFGEIEQQMLTQICQQMQPGGELASMALINVGLSAAHLNQSKSLQTLLDIVKAAQIDSHKLCFEFTEQSLLELDDVCLSGFKRIKNVGISITIQGFGASVSSLGLLSQNNIDYVKTDPAFTRSLLKNLGNQALLHTLMHLSNTFNFKVILEGVDSQALQYVADENEVLVGLGKFFTQQAKAEALAEEKNLKRSPPKLVLHNFG